MPKVLVYGAGPLGSLFAARLQQGGNKVSILARGSRLAELREHGEGDAVHCLTGSGEDEAAVPFGEVVGVDACRLARTRDLVVLTIRAMREGFRVLRCLGLPVTPAKFRVILWLPEPVLVLLLQCLLANPLMETARVKHAEAARDEVQHLIGGYLILARTTPVPTPTIDHLLRHYEPGTRPVPYCSAQIPLRGGGLVLVLAAAAALAAGTVLLGCRILLSDWRQR